MSLLTIAASLLASAAVAAATSQPSTPSSVPGAYIIEFDENANANDFSIQSEVGYGTRREFDYELFKGISIQLDASSDFEERAAQLAGLPAVKRVWPVRVHEMPRPVGGVPAGNSTGTREGLENALRKRQANGTPLGNAPHVMSQVDKLHAKGITGKGIKVAVIDDGVSRFTQDFKKWIKADVEQVDYHHPALGGCFGDGCVVAFGYDLVGDDYSGFNDPVPDDDPDATCEYNSGHGTHVAGIIAASGDNPHGFIGAAPGVTLGAYRISGCRGGVSDEVLIDAFNMAYEDGADIITSSIGSRNGWSSDPWTVTVSRIVEKGVPCTIAQGNGNESLFFSASPADGKGVTAVASFQNTNQPTSMEQGFFTLDGGSPIPFGWDWGFPNMFDGVERELWVTGYDIDNPHDACEPLPDDTPDLSEYIVLLRRSTECSEVVQAVNVAQRGARFLLIYNNGSSFIKLEIDGYDEAAENIVGSGMVLTETGESWVKAMEAGATIKAQIKDIEESKDIITIEEQLSDGGVPSDFNSWGPTFEMDLKPQFSAPGGNIISTVPLEDGGYMVMSGTSMATPFAAGVYALLAEARGTKPDPRLFERLLTSTAKPALYHSPEGSQDWLAPPVQQGSGLIQAYDAAYASSYLEPSSLSFNDTANFPTTLNFTIINSGGTEVSYEIAHLPSHSFYSLQADTPAFPGSGAEEASQHAELAFSSSAITIAPGDSTVITVTASPPEDLDETRYPLWSGFIVLQGSDGKSLSLPYHGLLGSLNDAILSLEDETTIVVDGSNQGQPLPANTTFTVPPPGEEADWDAPVPYLNLQLLWGTPHLSVHVIPVESNYSRSQRADSAIGQLPGFPLRYLEPSYRGKSWLGELDNGEYAPPGEYKIAVEILKIFGDEAKEEDWHVVESIPFVIQYAEAST